MAIPYLNIKKQSALRLAQMVGSDQNTLEAAYNGDWLAALDGAEIPISGMRDVILEIEGELHHIIGSDAAHPYRTYIYGRSVDLVNLASTPSSDNNNDPFVGVFDSVADSDTNAPLTVQPTQTLADEADDFFDDTELFNYSIVGNQLRHTRPLAYLQGCTFNLVTAQTAYDADGDSRLPDILENTWICGVCASSMQVGWSDNTNASGFYAQLYQQGIQMLRIGATGKPNLPLASQNVGVG